MVEHYAAPKLINDGGSFEVAPLSCWTISDGPLLPFPGRSLDIPEIPASVETGGEASMGVRFDAHMGVNPNFCM